MVHHGRSGGLPAVDRRDRSPRGSSVDGVHGEVGRVLTDQGRDFFFIERRLSPDGHFRGGAGSRLGKFLSGDVARLGKRAVG